MKITLRARSGKSEIYINSGCAENLLRKLYKEQEGRLFVVTDKNVAKLYPEFFSSVFCGAPRYTIRGGERSKNFSELQKILAAMHSSGVTRTHTLVAVGGGVVGDIAGLAAALYMRGISCVQIPTTLLAQVDSSVGGKTAVDFCGVKNLVGAIVQPKKVFIGGGFLKTLPKRELRCGLGEIIKYGVLDGEIYSEIIKNSNDLYAPDFLSHVVPLCVKYKAQTVESDEGDVLGIRARLNLGHTTAHAAELLYPALSHGECVLIGLYYEAQIAFRQGICAGQFCKELCSLIKGIIKIPAFSNVEELVLRAESDKKNKSGGITLCVPAGVGKAQLITLSAQEYRAALKKCAEDIKNA